MSYCSICMHVRLCDKIRYQASIYIYMIILAIPRWGFSISVRTSDNGRHRCSVLHKMAYSLFYMINPWPIQGMSDLLFRKPDILWYVCMYVRWYRLHVRVISTPFSRLLSAYRRIVITSRASMGSISTAALATAFLVPGLISELATCTSSLGKYLCAYIRHTWCE